MQVNDYTPEEPTGIYHWRDAVKICKMIEPIISEIGFHVALTGGCLYGEGSRKDIDLVFYRIRQVAEPNMKQLYDELEAGVDMILKEDFGFCKKFIMGRMIPIDVLFPENWCGGYNLEHLHTEKETKL